MLLRLLDKGFSSQTLPSRIDSYLRHRFPEIMGVKISDVRVKQVKSGRNTELRRIELAEKVNLLLRFYPFHGRECKGYDHYYLSNLLQESGVFTPRILWLDNKKPVIRQYGFEVIAEQYITGKELNQDFLTPAGIDELIEIMLKLHRRKDRKSGKPWQRINERRQPLPYFKHRCQLYFKRLKDQVQQYVNGQGIRELWTALNKEMEGLNSINEYNLVHGDIHFRNLLIDKRSTVYLIDFGTCHYGYFEEDLVAAYNGIFKDTPLYDQFLERYFQNKDAENRRRYQRTQKFFFSYFFLEKTSSATMRLRKSIERRAPEQTISFWRQRAQSNWDKFLEHLSLDKSD